MIATHSRLRAKVSSVVIARQGSNAWATHVGDLISTQISLQVNALEIALAVEARGGRPSPASVDTVARPGAQTARARFNTGAFTDRVLDAKLQWVVKKAVDGRPGTDQPSRCVRVV